MNFLFAYIYLFFLSWDFIKMIAQELKKKVEVCGKEIRRR